MRSRRNFRRRDVIIETISNKNFIIASIILTIIILFFSGTIIIKKQIDRLVIKGRFKKCSEVKIILYKYLNSKIYNFPVSKKPYTALCVDILTDEENENGIVVTKYINDEGLQGKYSIYLEIDSKLYDTEKYVEF